MYDKSHTLLKYSDNNRFIVSLDKEDRHIRIQFVEPVYGLIITEKTALKFAQVLADYAHMLSPKEEN